MEKHLFPSFTGDQPLADLPPSPRMSRMETAPEDHTDGLPPQPGCGCGQGNGSGNGGNGQEIGNGGCGYVGFEGCGPDSWGLCEYPLAMVYAPCQVFRGLYDPDTALTRGTLFTELDLPLGRETCGLVTADRPCRGERRHA